MKYLILLVLLASASSFAAFPTGPELEKALGEGKYIHAASFAGQSSTQWARESEEIEALLGVKCSQPKGTLTQEDVARELFVRLHANNWEEFRRFARCDTCEAFMGQHGSFFNAPTMRWGEDAHQLRRKRAGQRRFWINDGYGRDANGNQIVSEFNFGSDLMDDVYLDTPSMSLISNQTVLRARKRWDSWKPQDPQGMRRILVGMKHFPETGSNDGFKSVDKLDIRFDGPTPELIKSFLSSIPTGFLNWNSTAEVIMPVQRVYDLLKEKPGNLVDVGTFSGVMQLEPMVFNRSLRRRVHMLDRGWNGILPTIRSTVALSQLLAQSPLYIPATPEFDSARNALKDVSRLSNSKAYPAEIPATEVFPNVGWANPFQGPAGLVDQSKTTDAALAELEAETPVLRELIEKAAFELRQNAMKISGSTVPDRKEALALQDWHEAKTNARTKKLEYFFETFNALAVCLTDDALAVATTAEYNAFLKKADPAAADITQDQFKKMIQSLRHEQILVFARMLETGSDTILELPRQIKLSRYFNFGSVDFINTMDLTVMLTADPIEATDFTDPANKAVAVTPVAELTNNTVPTDAGIRQSFLSSALVNEVQIELGSERPFTEAIKKLEAEQKDPTEALRLFADYQSEMLNIVQWRKEHVLRQLNKNAFKDLCESWEWAPREAAKGESALKILKGKLGL